MKSRHVSCSRGFALVIALFLMGFITLLLLSLSTLTQVEIRSAALEASHTKARSNAKFALMQAIGKIQTLTGPDQRVTASADIITPDGVYAEERSADKRHWIGVWNVEQFNLSGDPETQGRNNGDPTLFDDAFAGWLVSDGGDPATVSTATAITNGFDNYAGDNMVDLVGEGSVLYSDANDTTREGVRLPKTPIDATGNYAFWVSDESLKANFAMENPFAEAEVTSVEKRYGQTISLQPDIGAALDQAAQARALTIVPSTLFDFSDANDLGEQVNTLTAAIDGADKEAVSIATKIGFHDVTSSTFGVLADVRNGGLKRDLSLAMEMSDIDFQQTDFINSSEVNRAGTWRQQLNGADMLLGYLYQQETNESINGEPVTLRGPTWQLLRSFYRSYRDVTDRTTTPAIAASAHRPNLIDANKNQIDGQAAIAFQGQKNGHGHDSSWQNYQYEVSGKDYYVMRNTQTQRMPILTNAEYIFGVQRENDGGQQVLALSLNFVATVMNPYNVAIEFQGYQLMLHSLPVCIAIEKYGPTETIPDNASLEKELYNDADYGPYVMEFMLRKQIDGMDESFGSGSIVSGEMGEPIFGNFILTEVDESGNAITDGSAKIRLEPGEIKVISLADPNPILDPKIGLPATYTWNDQGGFRYTKLGLPDMFVDDPNGQGSYKTPNAVGIRTYEPTDSGYDVAIDDPTEIEYPLNADQTIPLADDDRVVVMISTNTSKWREQISYYKSNSARREGRVFFNQMLIDQDGDLNEALNSNNIPRGLWTQSMRLNMSKNKLNDDFPRTEPLTGAELNDQQFIASTSISLKTVDDEISPGPYMNNFNLRLLTGRDLHVLNKGESLGPPQYLVKNRSLVDAIVNYPIKNGEEYDGAWGSSNSSSGDSRVILFEVPTTPMVSLGAFQHADINIMPDQPTYGIGFSFANVFVPRDRLWEGTSDDKDRDRVFADTAYLANEAMWDSYYFSTLSAMSAFDGSANPTDAEYDTALDTEIEDFFHREATLPNPNFISAPQQEKSIEDIIIDIQNRELGYKALAGNALMRGAFNVNSTSVAAWKSLLGSLLSDKNLAMTTDEGAITSGALTNDAALSRTSLPGGADDPEDIWVGVHGLTEDQLTELAEAMVDEVKARGPFTSVSDFVNRRPNEGDTGLMGTIQAAIDNRTTVNEDYLATLGSTPSSDLSAAYQSEFPYMENFGPESGLSAPGYLSQGDVLTAIGPYLNARGDTFLIRAYGDVTDPLTGEVEAQAWCEAVVQRMPDFVNSEADEPYGELYDSTGGPNLNSTENQQFGRRYRIIRFRWLEDDEV